MWRHETGTTVPAGRLVLLPPHLHPLSMTLRTQGHSRIAEATLTPDFEKCRTQGPPTLFWERNSNRLARRDGFLWNQPQKHKKRALEGELRITQSEYGKVCRPSQRGSVCSGYMDRGVYGVTHKVVKL